MFEKRIVSAYYLFDMGKEVLCKSSMDVCSQERMSRNTRKEGEKGKYIKRTDNDNLFRRDFRERLSE